MRRPLPKPSGFMHLLSNTIQGYIFKNSTPIHSCWYTIYR